MLSQVLDPLFVGITVGVGASLGKCVSYAIGRGGRAIINERKKKELECFGNLLGKYGIIAVYLFASLPLPDDIIVMPFGIIKYDFKKFFVALLLGKLTLGMIVAYVGRFSVEFARIFIGDGHSLPTIVISVLLMLIFTWIIYKINWIEATEYVEKHGVIAYIKFMLQKKKM